MRSTHAADDMTPARLRLVLAVATTGSFTEAALATGTSQSNVSRSVAAVEAALGAPVFHRSTRSVQLTDSGREFVERAAQVVGELDAAVRTTRPDRRPTPRLAVASLTSVSELYLPAVIADLGERVPRFRCIEGLQSVVEQAVRSGQAAFGLGDLADPSPDLATRPLWREPFRLAVASRHRLARRRRVDLDEVASEPLVGFSRDAELRSTTDRRLAAARQLRAPDYIADRYRTALGMVAARLGVMVVPGIVVTGLPPGVTLVDLDGDELHRTVGVLRRPGADPANDPVAVALLDGLRDATSRVVGVESIDTALGS